MNNPTYKEFLDNLDALPNKKAPGPSTITNEILSIHSRGWTQVTGKSRPILMPRALSPDQILWLMVKSDQCAASPAERDSRLRDYSPSSEIAFKNLACALLSRATSR